MYKGLFLHMKSTVYLSWPGKTTLTATRVIISLTFHTLQSIATELPSPTSQKTESVSALQ